MANPDSGVLENLKKDDLMALGRHLCLDVKAKEVNNGNNLKFA